MAPKSPYPAELRKRAVRMVAEVRPDYPTEWVAINAGGAKLGTDHPAPGPTAGRLGPSRPQSCDRNRQPGHRAAEGRPESSEGGRGPGGSGLSGGVSGEVLRE
jgi:hypothetical protein